MFKSYMYFVPIEVADALSNKLVLIDKEEKIDAFNSLVTGSE